MFGTRRALLGGNALDPDALAYFAKAGISDVTAKSQINSFVKQVKGLGLWSNMVCWPLRSSQNNGSSNTQISLGGLGNYPLVLANSPLISSTGLGFNGTNQYAKCSQSGAQLKASNYPNAAQIAVFNPASNTQSYSMIFGQEDASTQLYGMMRKNASGNDVFTSWCSAAGNPNVTSVPSYMNYGAFNVVYNRVSPTQGYINLNNATEQATSAFSSYPYVSDQSHDVVGFGARTILQTPAYFATMTASFGAFIGTTTSATQMTNLYTLYKNTLGQGLALP